MGPTGGEGAKFWMGVLTEIRNRGVQDTFIVCCDGLKGLPDSIRAVWPQADVQLCVVHYADVVVMPMWSCLSWSVMSGRSLMAA